jgi:hypothetical protein
MTDHSPPSGALSANPLDIARLLLDEDGKPPKGLPPVHRWNPPFCGDIDMVIKRNGQWFYMGTPIGRPALVKLFSTVLRRDEDDEYYLVTPVEKVRIRVEDAPFLAVDVDRLEEGGETFLRFTTQTGDRVIAGPDHPVWVEYHGDEPAPYIHVRDRLHALISRSLFYHLIASGELREQDGAQVLCISSSGQFFEIGRL